MTLTTLLCLLYKFLYMPKYSVNNSSWLKTLSKGSDCILSNLSPWKMHEWPSPMIGDKLWVLLHSSIMDNHQFLSEYKFQVMSKFGHCLFFSESLMPLQIYCVSVFQCIFTSPLSVFVQSLWFFCRYILGTCINKMLEPDFWVISSNLYNSSRKWFRSRFGWDVTEM